MGIKIRTVNPACKQEGFTGPEYTWRELSFRRDIWQPTYYFFWKRLWWVRRIWCKHGVHTSGTDTNFVTICSSCRTSDVPQTCHAKVMV